MPFDALIFVAAVIAMFVVFEIALVYVNAIASARAITFEEEQAARRLKADAQDTPFNHAA